MQKVYTLARWVWNIAKGVWTLFGIVALATYCGTILSMQEKDLVKGFASSVLGSLFIGHNQQLALRVLGPAVLITLIAAALTAVDGSNKGGRALRGYLRSVRKDNQDLKPGSISQADKLVAVNVPLDQVLVHLRVVSDRPMYDTPSEQLKALEELRQHSNLAPEQRGEYIRRLRLSWYSQLDRDLADMQKQQNIPVEAIISQLTKGAPVAVILGSPGSGKSTTMRWLAYHMARVSLLPWYYHCFNGVLRVVGSVLGISLKIGYHLPNGLSPKQIPILLRISDFAEHLRQSGNEYLSIEQFIIKRFSKQPHLADCLLNEMKKGRCLLLLDGLDEVQSSALRRRVGEAIYTFITDYSTQKRMRRHYNRFIITSRIVGYKAKSFNKYPHYTLLDFQDEQIEQFLTNWCPAAENARLRLALKRGRLTHQQEKEARARGLESRNRLLDTIRNNPNIKRLAVNPLMLTILAFLQRSNKILPQHRAELYRIATRTLLENWNQETERQFLEGEEIDLAERLLGELAYLLYEGGPLLSEKEVQVTARRVFAEFRQQPVERISEQTIQQFIKVLRSSSSILVERGPGLFDFMHRTYREYYAASYLLRKPLGDLKKFIIEHFRQTIWREPLLLVVAYKSGQASSDDWKDASELIQAVADTSDIYDSLLHRNLLFAANSLVDCSPLSIDHALQRRIANHLFDLYADFYGAGRYTQLQQEIEKVAVLWLRAQPPVKEETWPPLLDAWQRALCNADNAIRREGAVHLLSSIALDLPGCPESVLLAVVPPLLQLADLSDLPCPAAIRAQLSLAAAQPASLKVEEYAFITLRLLDIDGPAGWLHAEWLNWAEERPELLERLTQHALQIDYFLSPAALPARSDSPNWEKQRDLIYNWKQYGQRNPRKLQLQMLYASNTARLPLAYLLRQLLLKEEEEVSKNVWWRLTWDNFLKNEMMRGRSATYQTCLYLRLLLYRKEGYLESQNQSLEGGIVKVSLEEGGSLELAEEEVPIFVEEWLKGGFVSKRIQLGEELIEALSAENKVRAQALIAIAHSYLRHVLNIPYERYMLEFHENQKPESMPDTDYTGSEQAIRQMEVEISFRQRLFLLDSQYLLGIREKQDISDIVGALPKSYNFFNLDKSYLSRVRDIVNIRDMHKLRDMLEVRDILHMLSIGQSRNLSYTLGSLASPTELYLIGIEHACSILHNGFLLYKTDLVTLLYKKSLVTLLCDILEQREVEASLVLLTLYSILTVYDPIPPPICQQVRASIQNFKQRERTPGNEAAFFSAAILNLVNSSEQHVAPISEAQPKIQYAPDLLIDSLNLLRQQRELTKSNVDEVLAACIDTRQLSESKQKEVGVETVQETAWELLARPFNLEIETLSTLVQALDQSHALICQAAALLLQRSGSQLSSTREKVANKLMNILRDEKLPQNPLDLPPYCNWRLDDVLYEALRVYVE